MKESILVYYAVMQKFIAYAALATFFLSVGMAVDGETGSFANFVRAFCIIWSALIFIALAAWVWHEGHAQAKQHEMQMALLQADIDSIAPPVPEAAPVAPKVPFPPYRFVQFAWDWYEAHGKFPTVRQCEESKDHFAHSLVQLWYQQMVSAGAIVNRVEGQSAGDPMWSREKCEKAAIADSTFYQA